MKETSSMDSRAGTLAVVLVILAVSTKALPAAAEKSIISRDGVEMVLVPEGPFIMGTGDGEPESSPPHRRSVPAYYIDKYEVTNALYAKCVAATDIEPPLNWNGPVPANGAEDLPVTNITWFDAMRYAVWAGKRLPTEAEWEKAGRGTGGRRYPWGNADIENRRNKDSGKLRPRGGYPEGASPYGVLDMSGNAWEWTADWYLQYPASGVKSIHFGRKYKVVRGGGGEYLYGIANTGNMTQRARLLAYGSHDFVGFRCAKSPDGEESPYDPEELLNEASSLLNSALRPQVPLSYESEYSEYVSQRTVPVRIVGNKGEKACVRTGVPFERGLLSEREGIRVFGPDDAARPIQTKILSRWEDGSLRWVLVDFPAMSEEQCRLDFSGEAGTGGMFLKTKTVSVKQDGSKLEVDTGVIAARISRESLLEEIRDKDGDILAGPMTILLRGACAGRELALKAMPAEQMEVEENGPVCVTIKLAGRLGDENGPSNFNYMVRLQATVNSSKLKILVTVTHGVNRQVEAAVDNFRVDFALAKAASEAVVGTDHEPLTVSLAEAVSISQPNDLNYLIRQGDKQIASGTRSPGWVGVGEPKRWFVLGVRDFWQNHPKALSVKADCVSIALWPKSKEALTWEGGLAKTHEFVFDFCEAKPGGHDLTPLRGVLPGSYMCGTEALGGVLEGKECIFQP